jgi:hypothetical protein
VDVELTHGRSLVIQHLRDAITSSQNVIGDVVLSVFCSHDSQEMQTGDNLVASLLRQIIEVSGRQMSNRLKTQYEKAKMDPVSKEREKMKLQDIVKLLKEELKDFRRVYIIVDALDECAEFDDRGPRQSRPRQELVNALSQLVKAKATCVRVLVTTRPDPSLRDQYQWQEIVIKATDEDIQLFLEQQIKQNKRIEAFGQSDLIKAEITKKAQGM